MYTIVYDSANGATIPDGKIEAWVSDTAKLVLAHAKHGICSTTTVGSKLMVRAIRVAIHEELIASNLVNFKFEGEIYSANKEGMLIGDCPSGFCDFTENLNYRLLS